MDDISLRMLRSKVLKISAAVPVNEIVEEGSSSSSGKGLGIPKPAKEY